MYRKKFSKITQACTENFNIPTYADLILTANNITNGQKNCQISFTKKRREKIFNIHIKAF